MFSKAVPNCQRIAKEMGSLLGFELIWKCIRLRRFYIQVLGGNSSPFESFFGADPCSCDTDKCLKRSDPGTPTDNKSWVKPWNASLGQRFLPSTMPSCMAKFGHWLCPPKLLANSQSNNPRSELCTQKVSPLPVLRVWLTRPMRSENFGCPCLRSSWHSGTGPLVPMPNRLKVAVATFLPGRDIWKVEGGWVVAIGNWSDNWQVRWWATPRITSLWWWCARHHAIQRKLSSDLVDEMKQAG